MPEQDDIQPFADRKLVSLDEEDEVRYWTKRFGITEAKLRRAAYAVGVSVVALETWLDRGS